MPIFARTLADCLTCGHRPFAHVLRRKCVFNDRCKRYKKR